jgi:hypothetical protein
MAATPEGEDLDRKDSKRMKKIKKNWMKIKNKDGERRMNKEKGG